MTAAEPHPVVLIAGGEDFLAERQVQRIVRGLRIADPAMERRDVDATRESAAADFLDACSPGLFGESAIVVVDHVETSSEVLQSAILQLIADSNNLTKVLLIQRGLVKGKGFIEKIKKSPAVTLTFEKLKGKAIDDFIAAEFKAHKRKVSSEALNVLRTAVGDDIRALAGAVSQLASDIEGDPIDEVAVHSYYEGMAGVSPFAISDTVMEGKTMQALIALRWAMERDPQVGPAIVASTANALRGIIRVGSMGSGQSDAVIASAAGVPPWKVRGLRDLTRRWTPAQLADAILLLTRVDAALKAGEIDAWGNITVLDPVQRQEMLERALLTMARKSFRHHSE